jgi:predicted short-subunit dehydrogenase-like oxidoreductase (DUF2520 family)
VIVARTFGRTFRVIGAGRAGGALERALGASGSWRALPALGRTDDLSGAARDVDLLVVATPDRAVADVAGMVTPIGATVVAHLSGSLGLDALEPHPRRAAIHPLMTMPDAEIGAAKLVGSWFAIAGDPLVAEVVAALRGRSFTVDEDRRAIYHAAACVASNHVAALLGQVERLAAEAGVPFDAFFDIVRATVDNCAELGPRRAITGPAARGDDETIARHRAAIDPRELATYDAMVIEIRRLVS